MSIGRIRGIRAKLIEANFAVPANPADGTSLEERINEWFSAPENQTLNLIEIQYLTPNPQGPEDEKHVVMVLYTQ